MPRGWLPPSRSVRNLLPRPPSHFCIARGGVPQPPAATRSWRSHQSCYCRGTPVKDGSRQRKKKVAAACVGRGAGLGRRGAASGQWELPGRVRRRRPANQLWPGSGVPATVARLCRCRAHCRGRAPASRIRRRAPSRRGGRGSSEPPARPRPSVVCRHSPPLSRVLPRWREVAQDRGTQGGRRAAVCRWPKPAAAAAPLPPSPSRPAPPPAAPSAAVVAVYFLPCRHEPHGWHEGPEPR